MNRKSTPESDGQGVGSAVQRTAKGMKFNRRSGLIVLTLLLLLAATWQWDRLVALGIAPLILAVAPCLVMCGLGLCMQKWVGGNCSKTQQQPAQSELMTDANSERRAISGVANAQAEPAPSGALTKALHVNSEKQE